MINTKYIKQPKKRRSKPDNSPKQVVQRKLAWALAQASNRSRAIPLSDSADIIAVLRAQYPDITSADRRINSLMQLDNEIELLKMKQMAILVNLFKDMKECSASKYEEQ